MFSLGRLIFGLLALVACASSLDVPPVSTYRMLWRIDDDATFEYILDRLDGNLFANMTCTKATFPVEVNCKIFLRSITPNKPETFCPVKIFAPNHEEPKPIIATVSRPKILRLGKNRVILYWLNRGDDNYVGWYTKYAIVDMTDCTIMRLPEITTDMDKTSVLANPIIHANGFEIIVSQRSACNGMSICRLSYNEQGKQIGGPVAFNTSISHPYVELVAPNSIDKGFFLSGLSLPGRYVGAEHVSVEGLRINLTSASGPPDWAAMLTSSSHEMYAVCVVRDGGKTICSQFDASGKEKLRTAIFTIPVKLFSSLIMHNLAGGGMLVTIPQYKDNTLIFDSFYVMKFNADGSMDGEGVNVIDLNLHCDGPSSTLLTSGSEIFDNYCFEFACSSTNQKLGGSYTELIRHCIKKE